MTSAKICTVPLDSFVIFNVPAELTRPTTRLATVWPAPKFSVELEGGWPDG